MPLSGRPPMPGLWASLVAACTEHLPYKAAALFFSVVLWLVVSAEETAEELVPVRLAASMDSSIAVVGRPPVMRALVVGKGRDLMKIGDGPLVLRRVFTAETPESVRVELRPADIDLPSNSSVVVRDVQPRAFTLRFAPSPREARRRRALADSAARAAAREAKLPPVVAPADSASSRIVPSDSAAQRDAMLPVARPIVP